MAHTQPKTKIATLSRSRLLSLVIVLVLLYVLLPRLGNFKTSLSTLRHSSIEWLAVCLVGTLLSYMLAAMTYVLLAKARLAYLRTLVVQVAGIFANRLLPAGTGAMSVSFAYLRRHKHSADAATAVVAVNNLLGFLGHLSLFIVVLVFAHQQLPKLTNPTHDQLLIGLGVVLSVGVVAVALIWSKHWQVGKFLKRTLANIAAYRKTPGRFAVALGCSMLLTGSYVLVLYAAAQAVGVQLPVVDIFIVLTFGVAGATAVPTPGGLGGAEASIVGGFVLYGVGSAKALAIALLYRLFTYWFALLIGGVGFVAARRLRYI